MVKERQNIRGSNCLKGVSDKAIADTDTHTHTHTDTHTHTHTHNHFTALWILDEKGIKDSWK